MLQKEMLTVGPLGACCYILWNDEVEGCIVIDPGAEPERIRRACEGRKIEAILLTHGHFDHMGAVADLAGDGTEIVMHKLDACMLSEPELNVSWMIGENITAPRATRYVGEGSEITFAGMTLRVLHTPGHTQGGVCYQVGNWLFTGDTLFHVGCGRTDLPGGSFSQLTESLRRLYPLVREYDVLPGHEA